jgi:hypothetical protein
VTLLYLLPISIMPFNKKGEDWGWNNKVNPIIYQKSSLALTEHIYACCTEVSANDTDFKNNNGAIYMICIARGQCWHVDNTGVQWYGPDGGDGTSEACYWFMDHL